jgi:hypothetical protein
MLPVNEIICGDWIDAADSLPDSCVHCIATSPPYWGQRNYGVAGQLGLEKTPEEHIEKLVFGFRRLRRILRPDGVLWVNYGDKYSGSNSDSSAARGISKKMGQGKSYITKATGIVPGTKQGDLLGLAWRIALALQADGWYLRSDIIWAKALSFCDEYSGSTMPESVNGWRWERCRVSLGGSQKSGGLDSGLSGFPSMNKIPLAKWQPCPGCKKCEKNNGLVLRRGSWRPTKAHEYLFLLTKSKNYFCDMEAVKEEQVEYERQRRIREKTRGHKAIYKIQSEGKTGQQPQSESGAVKNVERRQELAEIGTRNLRDVWCINPQAWSMAHYATFPEKLVEPIIKVSTSEKGVCPKCGSQWARVVGPTTYSKHRPSAGNDPRSRSEDKQAKGSVGGHHGWQGNNLLKNTPTTIGWRPTCGCGIEETVPAVVYDPFMGSGTVAAVAAKLNRNYIGSELNEEYIKKQADLRINEAEHGVTVAEQLAGQGSLFEKGE